MLNVNNPQTKREFNYLRSLVSRGVGVSPRNNPTGAPMPQEGDNTDYVRLRKQLMDAVNQFKLTAKVMSANFDYMSTEQKESIRDPLFNTSAADSVISKVQNKEVVSQEEAELLVNYLESATKSFNKVSDTLKVSFSDMMGNYSTWISSESTSVEAQQKILGEIAGYLAKNNILTEHATELAALSQRSDRLTERELAQVRNSLADIAENTKDQVLEGTLSELNEQMGSMVMSQAELNEYLERNSLKSKFLENSSLVSTGASLKREGLGAMLGAFGLTGPVADSIGDFLSDKVLSTGEGSVLGDALERRRARRAGEGAAGPNGTGGSGAPEQGRRRGWFGRRRGASEDAGTPGRRGFGSRLRGLGGRAGRGLMRAGGMVGGLAAGGLSTVLGGGSFIDAGLDMLPSMDTIRDSRLYGSAKDLAMRGIGATKAAAVSAASHAPSIMGRAMSAGGDMLQSARTVGGGLLSAGADLLPGAGSAASAMGESGGLLAKGMGMAGKVAGKLALPLAVASSLYDGFGGWNDAANISGKKEEDLTFGDKAQSSLSSVASGLTFGMVDPETIFKGIDGAKGGIADLLGIKDEDSILSKITDVMSLASPVGAAKMAYNGVSNLFSSNSGDPKPEDSVLPPNLSADAKYLDKSGSDSLVSASDQASTKAQISTPKPNSDQGSNHRQPPRPVPQGSSHPRPSPPVSGSDSAFESLNLIQSAILKVT